MGGSPPPRPAPPAAPPAGCVGAAVADDEEGAAEVDWDGREGPLLLLPASPPPPPLLTLGNRSAQPSRNLSVCMHSTSESEAVERAPTPAPPSTMVLAPSVMAVTSARMSRRARVVASSGPGARVTRAARSRR